jgi:hypothetical protein
LERGCFSTRLTRAHRTFVEILENIAGNSRSDGQISKQSNLEDPYEYEHASSPAQVANKTAMSQVTLKEVVLDAKDGRVGRGE